MRFRGGAAAAIAGTCREYAALPPANRHNPICSKPESALIFPPDYIALHKGNLDIFDLGRLEYWRFRVRKNNRIPRRSEHIIKYEYVSDGPAPVVASSLLLQALGSARNAATFLLGIAPSSHLTFAHRGCPRDRTSSARALADPPDRMASATGSERCTRQEATMEIKTRLNVLATMLSFVFLAAIVFGMV